MRWPRSGYSGLVAEDLALDGRELELRIAFVAGASERDADEARGLMALDGSLGGLLRVEVDRDGEAVGDAFLGSTDLFDEVAATIARGPRP
jgi:hypothetical protein